MTSQPPFSILTAIYAVLLELRRTLSFFTADRFFHRGARRRGGDQSHFRLELLHQFRGAQFLRFFFHLHFLLVHVAHRHFHARFVDRRFLFDAAHHFVVRLADAGDLELLHGVRHLLLPLGAAIIADRVQ